MQPFRLIVIAVIAVAGSVLVTPAAEAQIPRAPLALEPTGATGEAIWPAFESWGRNEDGTVTLVMGYMNRNEEIVEVPIGDDNSMGPGDPDRGQPTHFLPGRHIGVFSVRITEEEAQRKLTWVVRVNNQVSEIAVSPSSEYFADLLLDRANGNTPPLLRVGASGAELQGPTPGVEATYTTTVGEALTLLATVIDTPLVTEEEQRGGDDDDDADTPRRRPRRAPLSVTWVKFRGPGEVTFEAEGIDPGAELTHPFDDLTGGETMTLVTFSEPGQYRLVAWGNDNSTAPGDGSTRQCCWTTAHVDVTVNP